MLLLFVQPANFSALAPMFVNASTPVNNFNISVFAAQTGLGNPVAGNFFLTGPSANATNSTNSSSSAAPGSSSTSPAGGTSAAVGRAEMGWMGAAGAAALLGSLLL